MTNATTRVVTAVLGLPVIIGAAFLGGWVFGGLVLVAALIAQDEVYRLFNAAGVHPHRVAGLLIGTLVGLGPLVPEALGLALVAALLYLAATPFLEEEGNPLFNLAATLFGVFYPVYLLTRLTALRVQAGVVLEPAAAFWLTLSVFLLVFSSDTFAYYAGRAFGKHPLAPRVSPKKTWEGSVGGAAGALAVAAVLKVLVLGFLSWGAVLGLAFLCGGVSQLGDLAESRMKRAVGVKDSGSILPGHGGLLDRFDAILLAAPLAYLFLAEVVGFRA